MNIPFIKNIEHIPLLSGTKKRTLDELKNQCTFDPLLRIFLLNAGESGSFLLNNTIESKKNKVDELYKLIQEAKEIIPDKKLLEIYQLCMNTPLLFKSIKKINTWWDATSNFIYDIIYLICGFLVMKIYDSSNYQKCCISQEKNGCSIDHEIKQLGYGDASLIASRFFAHINAIVKPGSSSARANRAFLTMADSISNTFFFTSTSQKKEVDNSYLQIITNAFKEEQKKYMSENALYRNFTENIYYIIDKNPGSRFKL